MLKRLARWRPAPGTVMGGVALFISLGGVGYAATGGNFILGNPNSATSQTSLSAPIAGKTLQVTNTSGRGSHRARPECGRGQGAFHGQLRYQGDEPERGSDR